MQGENETHEEETAPQPLPLDEVEKLVGLLKESGVGEIQVRHGELEITVKARTEAAVPQQTLPSETPRSVETETGTSPDSPEVDERHMIRSPVVGTFYRSPAPGEDVYVEVGDRVVAGQTLCIVEAMKLMNEIPADVSGEVVEVLAENFQGVEYDQPLFYLRPEE